MHERPEEVREIRAPAPRPGAVPVDDRDRDHVAEDEVRLRQVRVGGDLAATRELRALGQVVDAADELRSGPDGLLAHSVAVVRRREAVDVGQHRPVLLVDAEEARRAVEALLLEVAKQRVDEVGVRLQRPADGFADADDPRCRDTAGEWDLAHSSLWATSQMCPSGSVKLAVRIPHSWLIGPFSSSMPWVASCSQTASASSTQIVSWNRAPPAASPTFPGSMSVWAAGVASRLTIMLSNLKATEFSSS